MKWLDYVLIIFIGIWLILALVYIFSHRGCQEGQCRHCMNAKNCERKKKNH